MGAADTHEYTAQKDQHKRKNPQHADLGSFPQWGFKVRK